VGEWEVMMDDRDEGDDFSSSFLGLGCGYFKTKTLLSGLARG
jgi:hypothetical protein